MSEFIKNPNLPYGKVNAVIAGEGASEFFPSFEKLGIKVFTASADTALSYPVRSHADMLVHHLGGNRILAAQSQNELCKLLERDGFITEFIPEKLGEKYPGDILLNAARIGNVLLCNKNNISSTLLHFSQNEHLFLENVRQGYTKCSVAVLTEKAIITEDAGIAQICTEKYGMDVLLINKGCVRLDGYDYGFIGGACGKISYDTIAFTGHIKNESVCTAVQNFLDKLSLNEKFLSDGELRDIGGFLPISEVF
ncbi:MAG: hypothetical protein GX051_08620 [Clostridiales bacterium]|nr:hypothetical protein [Clostridiales bacterium]